MALCRHPLRGFAILECAGVRSTEDSAASGSLRILARAEPNYIPVIPNCHQIDVLHRVVRPVIPFLPDERAFQAYVYIRVRWRIRLERHETRNEVAQVRKAKRLQYVLTKRRGELLVA